MLDSKLSDDINKGLGSEDDNCNPIEEITPE